MQVSEHLHILKIPFQVPISREIRLDRFVNVLLVYGESEVILVDCGVAGAEERIFSYLEETGRQVVDLKRMVLSHSHPDHLGSARTIKRRTDCLIHAHFAEQEWIEDTNRQNKERPVPGFDALVGGSVPVDILLKHGNKIELGHGLTMEVIHTPGHSPGSISLHIPNDSAVFTGDAIPVPGDLPIFTYWQQSIDSITRISSLPKTKLLLSSWAQPVEGEEKNEVIANGLGWLHEIKKAVVEAASRNHPGNDPLALCRIVCEKLGLPPAAVNPLVARSFAACLETNQEG